MSRLVRARVWVPVAAALLVVSLLGGAPSAARDGEIVATAQPRVAGQAVVGSVLRAGPGRWEPTPTTLAYQWLRDGRAVRGADSARYRLAVDDLGTRMSVRLTATGSDGSTARAASARTGRVQRAVLLNRTRPRVTGVLRYTHTVEATPGRWSTRPTRLRYQWLRAGRPIRGATARRYTLRPEDVGRGVRVRVTAYAPGHRGAVVRSAVGRSVRHRIDVRRVVTYHVETRGRITADLGAFRRIAQETYDDARGWRSGGVQFRRVRSGGAFTLVLAEAGTVPGFSSGCSSFYSCRVGRFVIINQDRWQNATPPWTAGGRSLADYRDMVVNHETGHWLGLGHASCPRPGVLAPVMMQQSKGTQGCHFNPWPVGGEIARVD